MKQSLWLSPVSATQAKTLYTVFMVAMLINDMLNAQTPKCHRPEPQKQTLTIEKPLTPKFKKVKHYSQCYLFQTLAFCIWHTERTRCPMALISQSHRI